MIELNKVKLMADFPLFSDPDIDKKGVVKWLK